MTKKKKRIIVTVAMIGVLAISAFLLLHPKESKDDLLPVRLALIQSGNGWGYKIMVDEKVFINQEFVPAVSGNRPFRTKDQALAVGNLAVKKLVNGKMPGISMEELKSLKVLE